MNGKVIIALLVAVGAFFLMAYIFQLLWNGPVKKAFAEGSIRHLDYWNAMALSVFISLFIVPSVVIRM